ncbi:glycoside hydrolase family 131 protein [Aspergillus candidus]|uniref:Glycoside hydrolase 131 catalytic N-terminal domain-containing protein n=1 Tax=Aspergillus candidus TaxID=41067 RepID=A0A2I2FE28_ASPCN|nr:hypothetical protein BDW47DRAFT_20681 [Aspergillus candidus]PLB38857.1 hypothetical protein BDW47DRAFT_20681 [Aspergillus candidus]
MKPIFFLIPAVQAGTVIWNGIFNETSTVDQLDEWSWSNQVGAYQWYIHGSEKTNHYLEVSPDLKNPASKDGKGIRMTIDETASWNGQTMMRTELIPQTTSDLGSGTLFYHFSLQTREKNPPNAKIEHQIAFFESHFTELQFGGSEPTLRWMAGGKSHWDTDLKAGVWYNFAYEIDFSGQTVALWASEGAKPLARVGDDAVSAATETNSQDWHVGELRLDNGAAGGGVEDWFWSGVYVESGEITKEV